MSDAGPDKDEIERFLQDLKEKMKVFQVIFRNREKNLASLATLGITAGARVEFLKKLSYLNYVSGPNKDTLNPDFPDYFEFGLNINGTEVYVKISPGQQGKPVDCMSFHIAEYKLKYHFSKTAK